MEFTSSGGTVSDGNYTSREAELARAAVREFVQSHQGELEAWFREAVVEITGARDKLDSLTREFEQRYSAALERTVASDREQLLDVIRTLLGRDETLLRKGLDAVVNEAVAREVMATYSRDRAVWGDWTRAFSFASDGLAGPALERASAWADDERHRLYLDDLASEPIADCLERDPHALPDTADREGYCGTRHYDYWLTGLRDYRRISSTVAEHGARLHAGSGVFDLGCASGRVLRHFLCQADGLEVWGADINRAHVEWMNGNLPTTLRAFQCTILPTLPIPDGSLELVYALSVFTHIDEFEFAWLAELRRILAPGGIAYLSIHSDDTWGQLERGWQVHQNLFEVRGAIHDYDVRPELFQAPMPKDKVVFRWRTETMNNTNVFVSKDYVRRNWGRFFRVLDIVREGSDYQDVVVLQRTE